MDRTADSPDPAAELRDVIEALASLPRLPTSPGERRAAELIRDNLRALGCRADLEPTAAYHSYAWPIGLLSALGVAGAVLGLRGHRVLGSLAGAAAAAGIADDITGRWTVCRRLTMRPRTAWNVVAETGDPAARRTLCVLAHHDAAPSGVVFDQRIHEWLAGRHPDLVARLRSNPPLWWPVLAGPVLAAAGSAARRRTPLALGLGLGLASLAAMTDIGHRPAVPGANDNLSGVATLHALAARLRDRPVRGLRVMLVSAGAEEALQEGIRGFARTHFGGLAREHTWFLTVDTVGSGRLVLLAGEGPVRMHDYDAGFQSLVRTCAADAGIALRTGLRSRSSTDGIVPSRAGYPTATLVSVDRRGLMPHYHLDSDTPDHLDYRGIADAVRLAETVARRLAEPVSGSGQPDRAADPVT